MAVLEWDKVGERRYENGVDHGVLYIPDNVGAYLNGYAWNGLVSVTESPTGAEPNKQYADNIPYVTLTSAEEFGGTIEAFTYPDEFGQCDGTLEPEPGLYIGQQPRKSFGLVYRTRIGNDLNEQAGYKLHLIYGAKAAPSEKANTTVNDSPEAMTFSWELTTTPVGLPGYSPTAQLTLDSTKVDPAILADIEEILFGSVSSDPELPDPATILGMLAGTLTTTALPTAPTFNSGTNTITFPSVTGVRYTVDGVTRTGTLVIAANKLVRAYPLATYRLPVPAQDEWLFVHTP